MKVLIIGATHGNELLGTKLYQRLLQKRSPLLEHIDFIIGNPRAYAQRTRYTEHDLNRSYGAIGETYEHQRARDIEHYIRTTRPDLVLDMHTTACTQPNCLIIHNIDGDTKQRFLRSSHIETILQVQPMHDIATLGAQAIGYEVPNRAITPQLLDAIAADIQRFVDDNGSYHRKKLFVMQDKIYKRGTTARDAASFVNFEMHPLGFVPIMTGGNSYKRQTDYLGFKSDKPRDIRV